MLRKYVKYVWVGIGLIMGCRSYGPCPALPALAKDTLRFEELSAAFYQAQDTQDMAAYLHKYPALLKHYFQFEETSVVADDSVYASLMAPQVFAFSQNAHLDSLYEDVLLHYGEGYDELKESLARAWHHMTEYDAQFIPPHVAVMAAGLHRDLYLSDSLVLVGVDYFIGPSAHYPPVGMPLYLLKRYTPDHVAVQVLFYFSEAYNYTDLRSSTLLAEIIAVGKTYAFASHMQPCLADSTLIGYTSKAWEAATENEGLIWQHFLVGELLYQKNHRIKQAYIGERPTVLEIGTWCPGRIAQWLGWQIAQAYLSQQKGLSPQEALKKLMNEADPQQVLRQSGYQPLS